jgi:hypothetical protein
MKPLTYALSPVVRLNRIHRVLLIGRIETDRTLINVSDVVGAHLAPSLLAFFASKAAFCLNRRAHSLEGGSL